MDNNNKRRRKAPVRLLDYVDLTQRGKKKKCLPAKAATDTTPLVLNQLVQTTVVMRTSMKEDDDLPADFCQPDSPASDIDLLLSQMDEWSTFREADITPVTQSTDQSELLPTTLCFRKISTKEYDDLPADFCQPDSPASDIDLLLSPTDECSTFREADITPVTQSTDQSELLPTTLNIPMTSVENGELATGIYQSMSRAEELLSDTHVLSNQLDSVAAELAMTSNMVTTPVIHVNEHGELALYIGEPLQTDDQFGTLLSDIQVVVPLMGDSTETTMDVDVRAESVFLPLSVIGEQWSVQSCISPPENIAIDSCSLDHLYSMPANNDTVVVAVSQPDCSADISALSSSTDNPAVLLHSDLLLLDPDECEENVMIAGSPSGSQNLGTPVNAHSDEDTSSNTRYRKRQRKPCMWKKNVSRLKRQSGQQYINASGKLTRGRSSEARPSCGSCRFKCHEKISDNTRHVLHENFWKLTDDAKFAYYEQTTRRSVKGRTRTSNASSRRMYSYQYFFYVNNQNVRVCKKFYLSTLDISQRRVSYYHDNIRIPETGMARRDQRGKHHKNKLPEADHEAVRSHIRSFPVVSSHYCRASSSKQYLDSRLSIAKMYDLYTKECFDKQINPVKCHMYRKIFNTEFNLDFHTPKKDRCDACEQFVVASANNMMTPELSLSHSEHNARKLATKAERDNDRKSNRAVLCFDLQNVITVPSANVSNMFYKRKLNVYNLTGHLAVNLNKKGYCAVWHEGLTGRGGNDIASAVIAILKKIVIDFPELTELVLWADSCIPQNRNSMMSAALLHFLSNQTTLTDITQKFCEPGHSSIQEVDNLHSQIDRHLQLTELYSPLGVIRLLLSVNTRNPMKVIQMTADQFLDYKCAAKEYELSKVPYQRVKAIAYKKCHVHIKTSFDEEFLPIPLKKSCRLNSSQSPDECHEQQCHAVRSVRKAARNNNWLNAEKKKDIESMYPFMPSVDRQFMETLMKNSHPSSNTEDEPSSSRQTENVATVAASETTSGTELQVPVSQTPKRQQSKRQQPQPRRRNRLSTPVLAVNAETTRRSSRKRGQDTVTELSQSKRKRLR